MPHVIGAQTHVSIWIGSHSKHQWRQNFCGIRSAESPRVIIYFILNP